ncbi:MAG: ATP-binding cassette domain-containing protein [Gemmatimonadota bacterium]
MTLLALREISKRFGATQALDRVNFDVAVGEVHALLGENGAGKSTLMHIAYGLLRADQGTVQAGATATSGFASPRAARAAGLGMVHQHFTSIPALSVGENIALAAGWRETGARAERRAAEAIARLALPLDPAVLVTSLSVQLRQRLEIVMALAANARILLLDEPSAVLAPPEVRELLRTVRGFANAGGAVVLITHKLDEVFAAADRVTVLRRGVVTRTGPMANETADSLARAMLGNELPRAPRQRSTPGDVVVQARELRLGDAPPATFAVRSGEIVGIAAVDGNGQRALLRAVAGVNSDGIAGGALDVNSPVAFIPEDRTLEGLIADFSLTENVLLGLQDDATRWLDWAARRERTTALMAEFDVRAPSADVAAATLSGGNQQKLILARALARAPRVLVAEDPTRGLDIRATQAIHERLRAAAAQGVAVLMHSSDLDEVLELADRVFVMTNGSVREMPQHASRDAVGDAMVGRTGT